MFPKTFLTAILILLFSANVRSQNPNTDADSPFGLFGLYEYHMDNPNITLSTANQYLLDVNIKGVQEMYFNADSVPSSIEIYSRIGSEGGIQPPDTFSVAYENALRQKITQWKNRIKYWEVQTEPSGLPPPYGMAVLCR